ncbi:hypothetical protein [Peterkaempfera griseoplana]|uniref:hypothetical protein n=1 Tax=Peterkaempfera griseoplana TaxID=66896 RepID=UPI0006E32FCA|nr:hypothetical protein [Peterkaempfera griseoplana]
MATAPRDPRSFTGQARGLVLATAACLVLVSAYSAVFESDPWLWFAWTVLAIVTGAVVAMHSR